MQYLGCWCNELERDLAEARAFSFETPARYPSTRACTALSALPHHLHQSLDSSTGSVTRSLCRWLRITLTAACPVVAFGRCKKAVRTPVLLLSGRLEYLGPRHSPRHRQTMSAMPSHAQKQHIVSYGLKPKSSVSATQEKKGRTATRLCLHDPSTQDPSDHQAMPDAIAHRSVRHRQSGGE